MTDRHIRLLRPLDIAGLLLIPLLFVACDGSRPAPKVEAKARAEWTSFAPGLPADSFPAASRRFSDIVAPRWSDEQARDASQEAEVVMDALGLQEGMVVADVGAGDGYYVVRLAQRVGSSGQVFGEDIVPEYLELLASRVKAAQLGNVTIVRGDPHDPRLPPDTLDAALMIHMYHEISDPYALLWNLARSLRPSARLAILDSTQPTDRHGTPPWLLECELSLAGYVKERTIPIARDQSLGIFRAPAPDSLPSPASMRARAVAGACRQP